MAGRRPDSSRPDADAAHGLYGVHAWGIAALVRLPRRRAWVLLTLASWALFTGAWDRRALRD